jgi:cell division protein ZapA (FtsZ GTPase activity inhibitor)
MHNRFDINIAGYTLTVETERSADHMGRLSELLNERVRQVQKAGSTTNYLHVVMMAAMKLADEILEIRGEREEDRKRLDEGSRDILAALDEALEEDGKQRLPLRCR